jgi:high affinity Mn2+ porin
MKYIQLSIILLILSMLKAGAQNTDTLKNDRFSVHAQTTIINQFKPAFNANYSAEHSLIAQKESKTSITSTLFLGVRLWKGAQFFVNPEIAGGSGLSEALGVAAAPNGETFRVGDPAPKIYLARIFYKQIFSLSKETSYQENDLNQLGGRLPAKYISFTIGKIGVADYFDNNSYSHDPRTQFMSWALMSNGAWDYPANTRGYTPSFVLTYVNPKNELRYDISQVPLTANGNDMNSDVIKANSQTIEYTRKQCMLKKKGIIRVLGFFTTANMGSYTQSIALSPVNPLIEDTRQYGRSKYGIAINAEQELNSYIGCFFKVGWNDGNNETWMFTEIDRSASLGFVINGKKWKRKNDNLGIAYVISGLSKPHQNYLAAGGEGFMLGDGALNYSPEHLLELYYSFELVKEHLFLSGAYQLLMNPGYNSDRQGPINIFSVRLHAGI